MFQDNPSDDGDAGSEVDPVIAARREDLSKKLEAYLQRVFPDTFDIVKQARRWAINMIDRE